MKSALGRRRPAPQSASAPTRCGPWPLRPMGRVTPCARLSDSACKVNGVDELTRGPRHHNPHTRAGQHASAVPGRRSCTRQWPPVMPSRMPCWSERAWAGSLAKNPCRAGMPPRSRGRICALKPRRFFGLSRAGADAQLWPLCLQCHPDRLLRPMAHASASSNTSGGAFVIMQGDRLARADIGERAKSARHELATSFQRPL